MAFPYTTVNNVISIIKDEKSKDRQFATIKLTSFALPSQDTKEEEAVLRFCLQVIEGELKVGDIIQISAYANWRGSKSEESRHKYQVRKLRNLAGLVITEDMLKSSSYQSTKTIKVEMKLTALEEKHLQRGFRHGSSLQVYPYNKVIRIRRPIYNKKGKESDSIFSNAIPVCITCAKDTPNIWWIYRAL